MIDIKLLIQKEFIKKKLELKRSVRTKVTTPIQKLPLRNTPKNAGRLSGLVKPIFEDYQLEIIESINNLIKSDHLFMILLVPQEHKDKMIKWLKRFNYILVQYDSTIVLSWFGSKKWLRSHKLTDELLERELDRLYMEVEDFNELLDTKNWILPNLNSIPTSKIIKTLEDYINKMP